MGSPASERVGEFEGRSPSRKQVATVNASMVRALAQLQVKRRQRPR